MIKWAQSAIFNNKSFTSKSLQPSFAQTLQPFIKKAKQSSKYCGHDSCRAVVQVLKEHMASMLTTPETEGTCTAANVAKCRGGGTEEVCSTPVFGAKASQKFPLRFLDLSDAPKEVSTINDEFLYWEICSAVTECPLGSPQFFEITITFTIDATIETFDKSVFKNKLAEFLNTNAADAEDSVTAKDITLKVTAGSIKVDASIKAYTETVKGAIVKSLDAATTDALSTALGVKVLSKSSVSARDDFTKDADDSTGLSGSGLFGLPIAALVGILVGVVAFCVVIIGVIVFFVCKKLNKNKETTTKGVEITKPTTTADDKGATVSADEGGATVSADKI